MSKAISKCKTTEETYAGQPTVTVTVEIPKSLYKLARRYQKAFKALKDKRGGWVTLNAYIVDALDCVTEGDKWYFKHNPDKAAAAKGAR